MGKTFLYIDGTNLFAGLVELFGAEKIPPFSEVLEQIKNIFPHQKIYFYASYMIGANYRKRPELKKLVGVEGCFYAGVRKVEGLVFFKGHRSPSSGKEKGVDVHLSVDLVKDVLLKNCDRVVIMSGDADLIYPLEIARDAGVKTQAVFLPNRFSLEMAYKVSSATVLNYLGKFKLKGKSRPKNLKVLATKKPRVHAPGVG